MDPADTIALRALKDKRPTTVGELRAIMGLWSYYRQYRRFLLHCWPPLQPPESLLRYAGVRKLRGKDKTEERKIKGVPIYISYSQPIIWIENHQELLKKLIDYLVDSDFSKPFTLYTDASNHITIKYRSGRENTDAESLSRLPVDIEIIMEECTEELSSRSAQATVQSVEVQHSNIKWSMALSAQFA